MNHPWSQRWDAPPTKEPAPSRSSEDMTAQINRQVEGWEQCLRNQIIKHPRIALGVGLLSGLAVGWWVKR